MYPIMLITTRCPIREGWQAELAMLADR